MPNDKVKLANMALAKIGDRPISSFNEDTAASKAVSAVYDDILSEVLCEHPWTFAQKRATLTTVSGTPIEVNDSVSVIYSKPSDFLKLNFVSDQNAMVKVEQDGIISDTTGLKIIYTFKNENPAAYFPLFTTALVTRLAAELCFRITESRMKAADLIKEYEDLRLPKAIAMDSQQGTPVAIRQDEWESLRQISGAGIYAPPGSSTWHPWW